MTSPELGQWPATDRSYRRSEVSAVIGHGDAVWQRATHDVLRWRVKTASGFAVEKTGPVSAGDHLSITARVLVITIVEPVEVVAVVQERDRVGFSYRTRAGHPVSGEEAFIVHRSGANVLLTVRSLTRAAPHQPWRLLYPVLTIAQRVARRRYLRALRETD
jgi:uncharacterized protein (UPF0548 family)